jgi:hypothetical protein
MAQMLRTQMYFSNNMAKKQKKAIVRQACEEPLRFSNPSGGHLPGLLHEKSRFVLCAKQGETLNKNQKQQEAGLASREGKAA